jgi:hypothetical protein
MEGHKRINLLRYPAALLLGPVRRNSVCPDTIAHIYDSSKEMIQKNREAPTPAGMPAKEASSTGLTILWIPASRGGDDAADRGSI